MLTELPAADTVNPPGCAMPHSQPHGQPYVLSRRKAGNWNFVARYAAVLHSLSVTAYTALLRCLAGQRDAARRLAPMTFTIISIIYKILITNL